MLRFQVFRDGQPPAELDLSTAYLTGSENIPIRSDLVYDNGMIICRKRAGGPAALSLLWPVEGFGVVMLETTRLPEREEPYILNVELARGRMMRFVQKREDWGFLDQSETHALSEKATEARNLLVQCMTHLEQPAAAAAFGDQCLSVLLPLSEQAATLHADLLLARRIHARNFSRAVFGCRIDAGQVSEPYRRSLMSAADFVYVPMIWKHLHPQEHAFYWQPTDEWLDFLRRAKLPVVGGPLVQFTEHSLPAWLYTWENDFEELRDFLFEHIERVVSRYSGQVALWNVVSSLHTNAQFGFTFDQIMDLTRMSLALVKKASPNARTMIELAQPWGEYYAANQRSIPPLVYAEMVVQSAGAFDVFGVQLCFGIPRDGGYQRDLFQISSMLDRLAAFGKPVVISALAAPSLETPESASSGAWRKPWNETVQAKWLQMVTNVALSKPFVEALCWHNLADPAEGGIPASGLIGSDFAPKAAFQTWTKMRRGVMNARHGPAKPVANPS